MLAQQQTQVALGCELTFVLVTDADQTVVDECFRQLWLTVFEFEARCSRFLPESELSQFNRAAGIRQPVSPEFRDTLVAAKKMADISDGLYNPFVLPALQRAGYVGSMLAEHQGDAVDSFSKRKVVHADSLKIGDNWASIPYGTAIDLGGCGKGYIGDRLAEQADAFQQLQGYWLSLGGDVVTDGLDEYKKPWVVYIEAAKESDQLVGSITLPGPERYAIATSSAVRSAPKIGTEYHHIIDPRTEQPTTTDVVLATVYTQSALLADVLASCIIITGSAGAPSYLAQREALGGLLQTNDGRIVKLGAMTKLASPHVHGKRLPVA